MGINSNVYLQTAHAARQVYEPFVSGGDECFLAVVSSHALNDAARSALDKSAEALGYPLEKTNLIVLEADGAHLSELDLRTLLESLDPIAIVATDRESNALLRAAYRAKSDTSDSIRLDGRPFVSFEALEEMLSTPEDKQRVWGALKSLKRE